MLNYNQAKLILTGNNFQLKQYDHNSLEFYTKCFLYNFLNIHEKFGVKKENIDVTEEILENKKIIENSICLGIERDEKIIMTLMISKRMDLTFTEEYFGLDLQSRLNTDNILKYNLYQLSRLSLDNNSFNEDESETKFNLIKILVYFSFLQIQADNGHFAFCSVNKFSKITLKRLNIEFSIVTSNKLHRSVNSVGIIINRKAIDEFLKSFNKNAIISKYFKYI